MYQKPRVAKKLYFDVIPRAVDEYYTFLSAYQRQDWKNRLGNPVWHMHGGNPPAIELAVPFSLLLNLVSASNAQDKSVLWGFISRYAPGVTPEKNPELDRLTGYAIRYFDDFVKPTKVFRAADEVERDALAKLAEALAALPAGSDGETIQNTTLNVARKIERYQDHTKQAPEGGPGVSVAFFQMIYQVLIGQERGPRFGSFARSTALPRPAPSLKRLWLASWRHSLPAGQVEDGTRGFDRSPDRLWLRLHAGKVGGGAKDAFLRFLRGCLRLGVGTIWSGTRPAVLDQPLAKVLLADPARDGRVFVARLWLVAHHGPAAQEGAERPPRPQPAAPLPGALVDAGFVQRHGIDAGNGDGAVLVLDHTCSGRHGPEQDDAVFPGLRLVPEFRLRRRSQRQFAERRARFYPLKTGSWCGAGC